MKDEGAGPSALGLRSLVFGLFTVKVSRRDKAQSTKTKGPRPKTQNRTTLKPCPLPCRISQSSH